jgi:hypothetical protein
MYIVKSSKKEMISQVPGFSDILISTFKILILIDENPSI